MLYRTYRPQTFEQVVGQEHVIQTLRGALTSGRVGHAYLFAGPRGTGKTTVARVLAKAINCVKRTKQGDPDDTCSNCRAVAQGNSMDLIEIDAASNRGIDEMRSVKESASVAAPGGGYKVFLIDEVHMLTKDAFNALLKVLEEPPAHVVFILATTEAHKILPTVLSRVQRFDFKKLTQQQILEKLKTIATAEGLKITDDALLTIASASDGALRDAEVALTKIAASAPKKDTIDVVLVTELLGLIPAHYYPEFLTALTSKNGSAGLGLISTMQNSGIDLEHFSREFLEYLRKVLVHRVNPSLLAATGTELVGEHAATLASFSQSIEPKLLIKIITAITQARAEMRHSPLPQLPLELVVMELCN